MEGHDDHPNSVIHMHINNQRSHHGYDTSKHHYVHGGS